MGDPQASVQELQVGLLDQLTHSQAATAQLTTDSAAPPACSKAPSPSYYAWLEVDGDKVNLYNVQAEGKVVSGWVEAQFGAEVAICYKNEITSLERDLCQRGYADGIL